MISHNELLRFLSYDPDTGVFTWKIDRSPRVRQGTIAGTFDTKGYVQIGIQGRLYLAHRLAWMYVHGKWPDTQIDHINRKRNDNRLVNLRLSTQALNNQNVSRRQDNKSGVTGVWRNKRLRKWQAYIRINNEQIHLGVFDQFTDAVRARKQAEHQYHTFKSGA